MAKAVIEASERLVPVRMGGATRTFNEIQAHTYGPKVGDDGTPAGQPYDHTTRQLSVVRFDDVSDPANPKPMANWIVLGLHPEFTWGYDLINGDITQAAARIVDRELGTVSVFSQRETGTSGPHKDTRAHAPEERREFQDMGFAQLDRGARLLADGIKATLRDIETGTPQRESAYQPFVEDFDVAAVSQRFAPPSTRPYPGVSNCNTASMFHGDPRVPVLGLPDCRSTPTDETALTPYTSQMYDQLKEAGVPIPESVSATALTGVEETAAVHLMAIKLGDIGATICPCEQFTDTALNIESRLDRVDGNFYEGFDWTEQQTPAGRDWCVPNEGDGTWTCADPRNPSSDLAPISDLAYRRMRAQIHNDAAGWETDLATLGSEAEPADPEKIKGNFTHEEHTEHGYRLVLSVGMGNDYWGYMPEYREMRSHDHYRKALNGLGLHGADFLATRLSRMAASLNGGPAIELSPLDRATAVEEARAQGLADSLGELARAYTTAYERTLPADGGTPAVVEQPGDITRFSAAHLTFTGGSNYTDLPDVRVERRVDGAWRPYGDTTGDVQLMATFPKPEELPAWRAGRVRVALDRGVRGVLVGHRPARRRGRTARADAGGHLPLRRRRAAPPGPRRRPAALPAREPRVPGRPLGRPRRRGHAPGERPHRLAAHRAGRLPRHVRQPVPVPRRRAQGVHLRPGRRVAAPGLLPALRVPPVGGHGRGRRRAGHDRPAEGPRRDRARDLRRDDAALAHRVRPAGGRVGARRGGRADRRLRGDERDARRDGERPGRAEAGQAAEGLDDARVRGRRIVGVGHADPAHDLPVADLERRLGRVARPVALGAGPLGQREGGDGQAVVRLGPGDAAAAGQRAVERPDLGARVEADRRRAVRDDRRDGEQPRGGADVAAPHRVRPRADDALGSGGRVLARRRLGGRSVITAASCGEDRGEAEREHDPAHVRLPSQVRGWITRPPPTHERPGEMCGNRVVARARARRRLPG